MTPVKKLFFLSSLIALGSLSACKKCYDCTKVCGTCTKANSPTLFGCTGDAALGGISVEAWKAYLESPSQGYSCSYNNQTDNDVCDDTQRQLLENSNYSCIKK
jgi:hypothetical protein